MKVDLLHNLLLAQYKPIKKYKGEALQGGTK